MTPCGPRTLIITDYLFRTLILAGIWLRQEAHLGVDTGMGEEGGVEHYVKIESEEGGGPLRMIAFFCLSPVSLCLPFVLFSLADMESRRLGSTTITVGVRMDSQRIAG